jgi:hypothetical protein
MRQLQRHAQHRGAIKSHPRRPIRLLQGPAGRQRFGTVEHADVIETKKSARKKIFTVDILAVDPPREIKQKFLESALEEIAVAVAVRA